MYILPVSCYKKRGINDTFIFKPKLMKQAILLTVLMTVVFNGFARITPNECDMPLIYSPEAISSLIPGERELLAEIMNVTGLAPNFELKEAKVQNVEASVSHRKRYILYNPEYINWINNATDSKWAAIALLAHEIGHHLNGHTIRKSGSRPALELEADEFAGFVLYKLGASLQQSQEVMIYIAKTKASATHPDRYSRMQAIQRGWSKAANSEDAISTVKK